MRIDKVLQEWAFSVKRGVSATDKLKLMLGSLASRLEPLRAPPLGRITFRHRGQEISLACRNNGLDVPLLMSIYLYGEYEDFDIDWSSINSFVDLGANIGVVSSWIHARASSKIAMAIEPDPENLELLHRNLGALGGLNAQIFEGVFWWRPEELEMHMSDQAVSHSLVAERDLLNGQKRTVRAVDMSWVLERMGIESLDLVKMDIEGAELDIFTAPNLSDWIHRVRHILIECHSHKGFGASPEQIKEALAPHGMVTRTFEHKPEIVHAYRSSTQ